MKMIIMKGITKMRRGVKRITTKMGMNRKLIKKGIHFGSKESINNKPIRSKQHTVNKGKNRSKIDKYRYTKIIEEKID